MRVALYLRVSTDGQTTEHQRRELEARAAAAGWDVVNSTLEDWVFADGLSVRTGSTMHSGRGVGLAALRAAVLQLGGTVTVASEPGRGVGLCMTLPGKHASND